MSGSLCPIGRPRLATHVFVSHFKMDRRHLVRAHPSIDGFAGRISHDHSRCVALAARRPAMGPHLGVIAVVGVILQGILGGLRVTMMKDQIGIFHACVAQAFLGLLVFIALTTTKFWPSLINRHFDSLNFSLIESLAIAITVAIYVQLALGATMRHQHRDLAILDFPPQTAHGFRIPARRRWQRSMRGATRVRSRT